MKESAKSFPQILASQMGLEARYFDAITPETYQQTSNEIHQSLVSLGVSFEGKRLPVSLRPSFIPLTQIELAARDLGLVRDCINKLLERLLGDIRANNESLLTKFFSFYRPWYSLIAEEVRKNPHIMLMRFDAAKASNGVYKVMEPNGACPGGVIHCSYIRNAWKSSDFGQKITDGVNLQEYGCDSPDGFIQLMYDLSPVRESPTIALCNYKGVFANELASLQRRNEVLKKTGTVDGNIIICDIREIEVRGSKAYVGKIRIDVVYNKVDHLMINSSDPEIAGWVAASRLPNCEFVNSLAALYIAEAKSVFAAILDAEVQSDLNFDESEREAIARRVPRTRMMLGRPDSPSYEELVQDRHKLVVKADALTRGAGVHVGRLENANSWGSALMGLSSANSVIQDVIDIPERDTVHFNFQKERHIGHITREHWGVDFFFYGNQFGGVVSRCHSSMIFNVGNGGQEVPTFVVK